MSNPTNLPILLGSLTHAEFVAAHCGPTYVAAGLPIEDADWDAEAVKITLESHFYLPPYANASFSQDTSDKMEQLSDWVMDWATFCTEELTIPTVHCVLVAGLPATIDREATPDELPTLADWLRGNLDAIQEDGFYRAGPDGLRAAADLMECLTYLNEEWT